MNKLLTFPLSSEQQKPKIQITQIQSYGCEFLYSVSITENKRIIGPIYITAKTEKDAKEEILERFDEKTLFPFSAKIENKHKVGYGRVWATSLEEAQSMIRRTLHSGYHLVNIWPNS